MALPTVEEIRALDIAGGGFPWATDGQVLDALERAKPLYAAMVNAQDYKLIMCLHVAHALARYASANGLEGGQAGPVVSASAGGVSMSLGVIAVEAGSLKTTSFGQELEPLLRVNGLYLRGGQRRGWWRAG